MDVIKYPCWRFHRTEAPRLCADPIEEAALGAGWADTPAAFLEPEPEASAMEASDPEPKRRGRRKAA